jgi:anaerobic selenocysteine-containing dehydrogenase
MEVRTSLCRSCNGFCPVDVTIEDGRAVKVVGNRRAPLYHGYTCPKGRALPQLHHRPDRLLRSLKKQPDGSFTPIPSADLIDEISERIGLLLNRHGPRAIAAYLSGAVLDQPAASTLMISFLQAIGSPMFFTAATIDQPGLAIAHALHGRWLGGRIRPEERDLFIVVGGNPVSSKQYLPQNPAMQLKALRRRGARLVVVDPRRSETARVADVHLQPIPGEDPAVLAGLINLVIAEGGVDAAFVAANAQGFDALARAVGAFTPGYVAARAGIAEADLRTVARMLRDARKGDVVLGTGPSMATRGSLSNYLALCLNTLRGFWARAGDDAMGPAVLMPRRAFKAQPQGPRPAWGFGHRMRIRDLEETAAGMPLAALPDEILTPGEGQVRALFMHGGALQSWPQQDKTIAALRALDLMVMHETTLSPTARMADYVIATKVQFEVPAFTLLNELAGSGGHSGYGYADPFAFSQPAVLAPPPGSDLLEAWEIYYEVARRLGIALHLAQWKAQAAEAVPIDMTGKPRTEELYALMCTGSAVPLGEVGAHPDGHVFERAREAVRDRDADCRERLELGDRDMLAELARVAAEPAEAKRGAESDYRFRLIPSRMQNSTNTAVRLPGVQKWGYNPLFMHPSDMRALGVQAGEPVALRSRHGAVTAFVEADEGLRVGVVALMHGYGGAPGGAYHPRRDGANVNILTAWDDDCDPRTGMPRMGALPVAITRLRRGEMRDPDR